MNIFHKHDDEGKILFSVASAVEPGKFDLKELDLQFIPGITLFMTLSKDKQSQQITFDLLVRTAKQLAFNLNGELRDQKQNPLTLQTINFYRNNIDTYANLISASSI